MRASIRHAGLSEVSIADIEAAPKYFRVTTVQNPLHLVDRGSEQVLAYCAAANIRFIPWFGGRGRTHSTWGTCRSHREGARRDDGPSRPRMVAQP